MINVALAPVHAYTIYHHHVLVSLFLFASCFAAPCAILLVAVVEAVLLVRRFMVVVARWRSGPLGLTIVAQFSVRFLFCPVLG